MAKPIHKGSTLEGKNLLLEELTPLRREERKNKLRVGSHASISIYITKMCAIAIALKVVSLYIFKKKMLKQISDCHWLSSLSLHTKRK